MKTILTSTLFFLTIAGFSLTNAQFTSVNATDFYAQLSKDSIQLLDVRTPQEFADGHISNALLADWNDQKEFLHRIQYLNKKKPVFVYCLGGGRSAAAQNFLKEQGFLNVINLSGGITAWKAAGLPVEGKKEVPQIDKNTFLSSMPKDRLVLVDFGAEWCPPCRKMNPIIDELISEGYAIIKIDGGTQETLIKEYAISSFPTLILFKNGQEIKRENGFKSKEELINLLK